MIGEIAVCDPKIYRRCLMASRQRSSFDACGRNSLRGYLKEQ